MPSTSTMNDVAKRQNWTLQDMVRRTIVESTFFMISRGDALQIIV